ncbi:hypothetical protein [Nostoc sp.]|uniref:hypothetical protein n=1 Tax=Nostoc sp. TaxID=1180 RepID=UPI002FFC4A52
MGTETEIEAINKVASPMIQTFRGKNYVEKNSSIFISGMGIWGNGRFGLTLGAGVGLWSVIGWWRCRRNHVFVLFINLK